MTGQTHITTNGTDATMAKYCTAATFVRYKLGTITKIGAAFSVRYIGLWDHAASVMRSWATHSEKTPAETPTVTDTTDANGAAGPAQTAARARIQAQATAWKDRIERDYLQGLTHWAPDPSVPVNSLLGIEFEHPKFPAGAPDGITTEWSAFPWLRVTVEGRSLHPDAHEADHETKSQFKRKLFGTGDHASGAGLMDTTASLNSFTAGEIDILEGLE